MSGRIIGLDIGDARIGVAVSDPEGLIASPLEVIPHVGWGPDVRRITALCERWETKHIVSGLPLNMDGSEGFQARKVRELCAQLEKAGLIVDYQDERLTTVQAEDALIAGGMLGQNRKSRVDKVAAALILQQYLDARREESNRKEEQTVANDRSNEEYYTEEPEEMSVVELIDDETGETVSFEHLATLEVGGKPYVCLVQINDEEEMDEEATVLVLEIVTDENGEETYVSVSDEVSDMVFDRLMELMDEAGEEED